MKSKKPSIISKTVFISGIIVFIILLIINPEFIKNLIPNLIEGLLYPFGRSWVGLTIAENKSPYLSEALASFGGLFWLFFVLWQMCKFIR